jgi:hypothetical protein
MVASVAPASASECDGSRSTIQMRKDSGWGPP